jgi:hypothetical protein
MREKEGLEGRWEFVESVGERSEEIDVGLDLGLEG